MDFNVKLEKCSIMYKVKSSKLKAELMSALAFGNNNSVFLQMTEYSTTYGANCTLSHIE